MTFRANGLLLAAGDEIAGEEGLTSARWQVLGAVEMAGKPLTVPQIARRMGLARQSVHATVGVLVAAGLVERVRNDDHPRSPLVAVTALGHDTYRALEKRQAAWVGELAAGLPLEHLRLTAQVLQGSAVGSRTQQPWSRPTHARDRAGVAGLHHPSLMKERSR